MNKQHQTQNSEERLISRKHLANRWSVSIETIKRREREGLIRAIQFNRRLLRYRLSDVERIEEEALG
ncbi:MAG: hypothetical protein KDN22_07945 [Verrucomicrobiae bacterium]|nr:hypothetical protein [Verrucomicrobiae bacterium]